MACLASKAYTVVRTRTFKTLKHILKRKIRHINISKRGITYDGPIKNPKWMGDIKKINKTSNE